MSVTLSPGVAALLEPRWAGQRGRLEVWYLTFTDTATGTGGWVHLETVSPTDGAPAHAHGWMAVFPPDGSAVVERFGPSPVVSPAGLDRGGSPWCAVGDLPDASGGRAGAGSRWAVIGSGDGGAGVRVAGAAGGLAWDLAVEDDEPPLFTFPRAVWDRQLLPAAQVVPLPTATITGTLVVDGAEHSVAGPGGLARIYGHGNAQRWGWLHAPLDDGGVLEIVTATARRPLLRRVPPLALVQLRLPGEADWPASSILAAPRFRTQLSPSGFTVSGTVEGRRLDVTVELPGQSRVALRYVDPDGETATCTNSARATARITLQEADGRERRWVLDDRAHAEVGARPALPGSS